MVTDRIDERRPKSRMRDRYHSTRIYYAADQPPSFLATWTSRIAIFAAVAAIVTAGLHRLALLPTPVAITIAYIVIACAALSLTMAFIAGLDIWVTGRQGAARVFCRCHRGPRTARDSDRRLGHELPLSAAQRHFDRSRRAAGIHRGEGRAHSRRQPDRISGRPVRDFAARPLSRSEEPRYSAHDRRSLRIGACRRSPS